MSTMKLTEDGTQQQWRDGLNRLHRDPAEGPAVIIDDGRLIWWTEGVVRAVYWPPVYKEDGLVHAWQFKGTIEEAKAELPKRPISGPYYETALMFM